MFTRCKFLLGGLALALGALFACSPLQAEPYTWKSVKIGGGGFVTGVLFHPTAPDLVYCRTDVGGVYRWNQADQSWVALNDDFGGLNNEFMNLGVVTFAVDPVNAERVYLATGQYVQSWAPFAQLLSSTNRGQTWTHVTLPFKLGGNEDGRSNGERLQVDPNQPRILFIGTTADGLWRSVDNGRTWRKVTTFPEARVTLVEFDKSSSTYGRPSSTIYVGVRAAVATGPGLYRSTDSGATWAPVPGAPAGLVPHHVAFGYGTETTLYTAFSNGVGPNGVSLGSVWKLNVSTDTWTNISPPTGQGGFGGISVDASNPNIVVTTTMDRWWPRDEIYRTTNGGATWKAVGDSSVWDNSSAPWSVARSLHWVGDVDIDPTNPNRLMFITGYGLWATNDLTRVDSGQTVHWTFLDKELEETVPIALASPNSGIFHLISALGDIGGFRHRYLRGSPPLVDYFAPYRGTSGSIDFAENNAALFVRSVNDGTRGQYSLNGGTTWAYYAAAAPGATANGAGFQAVSADGSRIVVTPSRSAPAYSTDNGATWTVSTGGPTDLTRSYHAFADRVNPNKFYLFDTGVGRVFVSVDGGATFTVGATNLPRTGDLIVVPGMEGNVWLTTWTNGLYRSTDSGLTFMKVAGVQDANKGCFGAAAPGQVHPAMYIWGKINNVTGLYRSDDIGMNWVRINDDQHMYGYIGPMTGDPRVYGRVFIGTSGRGIMYGQPDGASYPDEEVDPTDPVFGTKTQKPIFTDFRESPWDIWNWGVASATFSLTNTTPVHTGTYSISAPFTESWGQIFLNRSSFPTDGLTNLKFWVHGGDVGGQGISIAVVRMGDLWQPAYHVPKSMVQANAWTEVVIPLSALGATNLPDVTAIAISVYDFSYASPTPTFYLDDIVLE